MSALFLKNFSRILALISSLFLIEANADSTFSPTAREGKALKKCVDKNLKNLPPYEKQLRDDFDKNYLLLKVKVAHRVLQSDLILVLGMKSQGMIAENLKNPAGDYNLESERSWASKLRELEKELDVVLKALPPPTPIESQVTSSPKSKTRKSKVSSTPEPLALCVEEFAKASYKAPPLASTASAKN